MSEVPVTHMLGSKHKWKHIVTGTFKAQVEARLKCISGSTILYLVVCARVL